MDSIIKQLEKLIEKTKKALDVLGIETSVNPVDHYKAMETLDNMISNWK